MRAVCLALLLATSACGRGSDAGQERTAAPPPADFDGAGAAATADRLLFGERLTYVLGCRGCHGSALQGRRFYELYASNLTREIPRYSDAQLARLIRGGERPDGRDLWAMPSQVFQHLSDPDLQAITAYLRSLPPAGGPTQPRLPWTADALHLMQQGLFKPAAQEVRDARPMTPADLGPQLALGRYITMVACAECHGPELHGRQGEAPDLIIASAYSREEFERLLTTGVPIGGRQLRLMGDTARGRFTRLTRRERDAVYAYLVARAARAAQAR